MPCYCWFIHLMPTSFCSLLFCSLLKLLYKLHGDPIESNPIMPDGSGYGVESFGRHKALLSYKWPTLQQQQCSNLSVCFFYFHFFILTVYSLSSPILTFLKPNINCICCDSTLLRTDHNRSRLKSADSYT